MQLGMLGCLMTGLEQQELRMKASPCTALPQPPFQLQPRKATGLLCASICVHTVTLDKEPNRALLHTWSCLGTDPCLHAAASTHLKATATAGRAVRQRATNAPSAAPAPQPTPGVRRRCHDNGRAAPPAQAAARQKVLERRCGPRMRRAAPCPHSAAAAPRGWGRRRVYVEAPLYVGREERYGVLKAPWGAVQRSFHRTAPHPATRRSCRPRCAKCAHGFGNTRPHWPPPRACCGVIATVTRTLRFRPIK